MRKSIRVFLALVLLFSFVFSVMPTAYASKKADSSRAIAIVFDNSGSMYIDGEKAWCRATYAMEVFASMLNKGDVLQIYPMHPITVGGKEYTMDSPFTVTDAAQASTIRDIYTNKALGTPIESVDAAANGLKTLKADKKYMIVLTDGDVFYKNGSKMSASETRRQLDTRFREQAGESMTVMYLGVGKKVVMPDMAESQYFIKRHAPNSEDALSALTEMCNKIFGRDTLPKNNITGKNLKFDISMSKLIIFVQGENLSDLKVASSSGAVGKLESTSSTKYGTAGCGNYKSVADTSLQGMMVSYTDCAAGNYTIEYKGTATSVEVYYEPDADLNFIFTDADGNLVDPNSLYEGDYKVSFGMKDARTGQLISSSLLGNPHYEGTYSINGKKHSFSHEGQSGEVSVALKMGDTFDANLTVTYLSGYTISKDSSDFGWPDGGIKVAPRPAGDFKLKITGGDSVYPLQDLENGQVFIAEVYYQDVKLTGKELEKVDLRWEPETSYAEVNKQFANDHYKLSLHYKDPNAPANTVCGECKVPIYAYYTAQGSNEASTQATLTYKIEDDFIPVKVELSTPEDYIVISKLDESSEIIAKLTMDGKPLTAENFNAVEIQVNCSGIKYEVTPNEQDSSYSIKLLSTEGIKEDDYPIEVTVKHTDRIGRESLVDDDLTVTLSSMPLWLKWLIILSVLLLIIILIWIICHIKVLPEKAHITRRDSRFVSDGDNETDGAHFHGELKGKKMEVYCRYDGEKMGIAMDVKPGKESYLSKPQTKRYAVLTDGVRKSGGETITEATIGTVRYVLNEDTGKLERTPANKSPVNLKHGMQVRYSGKMLTAGTTKTFTVTTKLNVKF